jgi:hypothetical protein
MQSILSVRSTDSNRLDLVQYSHVCVIRYRQLPNANDPDPSFKHVQAIAAPSTLSFLLHRLFHFGLFLLDHWWSTSLDLAIGVLSVAVRLWGFR